MHHKQYSDQHNQTGKGGAIYCPRTVVVSHTESKQVRDTSSQQVFKAAARTYHKARVRPDNLVRLQSFVGLPKVRDVDADVDASVEGLFLRRDGGRAEQEVHARANADGSPVTGCIC